MVGNAGICDTYTYYTRFGLLLIFARIPKGYCFKFFLDIVSDNKMLSNRIGTINY